MSIALAVFGLIFFKKGFVVSCVILWILSWLFFVASIICPARLSSLHMKWISFGEKLRLITNPLFLGLFYFVFLTPIALFLKVIKKDLLDLRKNSQKSFWRNPEDESSFKNQF